MRLAFVFLLLLLAGCTNPVKKDAVANPVKKDVGVVDMVKFELKSPVFENNGLIPSKYTCDGADINPPLEFSGLPDKAKSLVLIVDDPDAPSATWDHWVVFDIPVKAEIEEDSVPGTEGLNSFRKHSWGGPCPPSGTHRYFFKVYALDIELALSGNSTKAAVEHAMKGHVLANAQLIGLYKRK
ncbi:MAG: YbhB/YbcL family Raf kinase inhibitor-like protein [Candidatus Woesearchaeota archaeon]